MAPEFGAGTRENGDNDLVSAGTAKNINLKLWLHTVGVIIILQTYNKTIIIMILSKYKYMNYIVVSTIVDLHDDIIIMISATLALI